MLPGNLLAGQTPLPTPSADWESTHPAAWGPGVNSSDDPTGQWPTTLCYPLFVLAPALPSWRLGAGGRQTRTSQRCRQALGSWGVVEHIWASLVQLMPRSTFHLQDWVSPVPAVSRSPLWIFEDSDFPSENARCFPCLNPCPPPGPPRKRLLLSAFHAQDAPSPVFKNTFFPGPHFLRILPTAPAYFFPL